MPRRLSFDVVDGLGRIYVQCMAGEPGSGLSGAHDDDSGVGRRRRLAGGCFVSVPAGHAADAGLNVGGAKSESRECAECNDTAGPAGVGACGGRTGCRDGLR